jgi:transposase
MYIDIVPNRQSPPAVLLRESYRDGGKVRKRTVANLSTLPMEQVELLRRVLKGEELVPAGETFKVESSLPHGHVEVVLGTILKLGLDRLIASAPSRERDLVLAMIAQRILSSQSKLADTRLWHSCTLAEELKVADADENDLYAAMDWLLKRKSGIEKRFAKRHLAEGSPVFYDVSSSYYEGRTCPLARFGHDRDGKKGHEIIVYGMLTDAEGRPIGVQVYAGNTADPTTVPDQVEKLRERFGLSRVTLVGDRGMLTQAQIEKLRETPGLGWVSALRSTDVRKLVESGSLQLSLFDRRNLAEISSPLYPGERLVACFNPLLAEERRRKRDELLAATEQKLRRIQAEVERRTKTPMSAAQIGAKAGSALSCWKMGKHFIVQIEDGCLAWSRDEQKIAAEAALDGIYIIRTGEKAEAMSADQVVRQYKNLARVEEVFRTMKGTDILIRPIRHRLPDRVRAHIFLCMLAYYVIWHMKRSLAPMLFADETIEEERKSRDPVAPAEPTDHAKAKRAQKTDAQNRPLHSFSTLLEALKSHCRLRCSTKTGKGVVHTVQHTPLDVTQKRAYDLLGLRPL